ncbi:hypothetical protein BGX28_000714 [Mortierella sp. GBA30]|nr:hypothetical protein BGX28_000714 [Mortierella sp. GBA30]
MLRCPQSPYPLSEKATALGMGTFPQASVSIVRCDRIKEFSKPGMSIQFGPERLILYIDKNVTKIGHDNLKSVEVYSDGDPKVLVIQLKEKLMESSILAEFYDPSPHSGKARKITLLCHCEESVIIDYCKKLPKKGINLVPLSSDAAAKITSACFVKSDSLADSSEPAKRAVSPKTQAPPHRTIRQEDILFQFPFKSSVKSKSIAVHADDMSRLNEGEFLNDTLIEFGLKYVHSNLETRNHELADKTYIFNTFFYQRLVTKPGKGMATSYDAVKSWTNKIDLFSKKFIIVPIHENLHWYLAIITNPGLLLSDADNPEFNSEKSPMADSNSESETAKSASLSPFDSNPASPRGSITESLRNSILKKQNSLVASGATAEKEASIGKEAEKERMPPLRRSSRSTSSGVPVDAEEKPYILVLDSLGGVHPSVTKNLRSYLQQELLTRKNITKTVDPKTVPGKHAKAPEQKNFCDCGLFLLHYAEVFLKNPVSLLDAIVNNKKEEANNYWAVGDLTLKREQYREIMISLTEQYKAYRTSRQSM